MKHQQVRYIKDMQVYCVTAPLASVDEDGRFSHAVVL